MLPSHHKALALLRFTIYDALSTHLKVLVSTPRVDLARSRKHDRVKLAAANILDVLLLLPSSLVGAVIGQVRVVRVVLAVLLRGAARARAKGSNQQWPVRSMKSSAPCSTYPSSQVLLIGTHASFWFKLPCPRLPCAPPPQL